MTYRTDMTMAHPQQRTAALTLVGMGSITLDPSVRRLRIKAQRRGIADDWQAVGDDLRRALHSSQAETKAD